MGATHQAPRQEDIPPRRSVDDKQATEEAERQAEIDRLIRLRDEQLQIKQRATPGGNEWRAAQKEQRVLEDQLRRLGWFPV